LRPPNAVYTSAIKECSEDEFAALVRRGLGKDSNDEGNRAENLPPHGEVNEIFANAHAKGVDCTCIKG
jgi:hypothetical protein